MEEIPKEDENENKDNGGHKNSAEDARQGEENGEEGGHINSAEDARQGEGEQEEEGGHNSAEDAAGEGEQGEPQQNSNAEERPRRPRSSLASLVVKATAGEEAEPSEPSEPEPGKKGQTRPKRPSVASLVKSDGDIMYNGDDEDEENSDLAEYDEEKISHEPRLMIKKIVLENFKSYGGIREIGPFNKNFSAVVGPNGSGKSNTIDALLFVFGKRAKQIRLNKVSELIHFSKGHERLPKAGVTVEFHDIIDMGSGPEDYTVVEGSELTVTREALRNNSSNYFLDGKPSSYAEVTKTLRTRGIDLEHNRFLILQGEVEAISLMKPKGIPPHEDGFLEYFEDIIGTRALNQPISDGIEKLNELNELRRAKLDRFRLAEADCDQLDGPRKQAVAFVLGEKERIEFQSLKYLVDRNEVRKVYVEKKEIYNERQKLMLAHKKKMEVHERAVMDIEKEHNDSLIIFHDKKLIMDKAHESFQEFERLDVTLEENMKNSKRQIKDCIKSLEDGEEKLKGFERDKKRYESQLPMKQKERDSAVSYAASQKTALDKFEGTLEQKSAKIRLEKNEQLELLEPCLLNFRNAQAEFDTKKVALDTLHSRKQRMVQYMEELTQNLSDANIKNKQVKKELTAVTNDETEKKKLVEAALERSEDLKSEIDQLKVAYNKARARAEVVKESIQDEQTRGSLIKRIYEAARQGILTGMRGRLGNLGTIDKKYNVAVSTACGMLDAIVVDTVKDAEGVIALARKEKLGRVTCIILEKQQHLIQRAKEKVKTPMDAPRLIDLIKTKDEILPAFYYAIKNTLVAQNLKEANKMAYGDKQRWRVVTLDGSLIDVSGTMSGGGFKKISGGMSASICDVSPEDANKVYTAQEKAKAEYHAAASELAELEGVCDKVQKELSEIEEKKSQLELTTRNLSLQIKDFERRKAEHKIPELSAEEKKTVAKIEKEIDPLQKKLNELEGKHREVDQKLRELDEQLMNVGGEELRNFKSRHLEAEKKVESFDKVIKKIHMDIESCDQNVERALALRDQTKAEKIRIEKELDGYQAEHAGIDDRAIVVLDNYNKAKEDMAGMNAKLHELKSRRDLIINNAGELKKEEVDLLADVENRAAELRELGDRLSAYAQKLMDFKTEYTALPNVDDFEAIPTIKLNNDGVEPMKDKPRAVEGGPTEDVDKPADEGDAQPDPKKPLHVVCMERKLTPEELESVSVPVLENRILIAEQNLKNMKPNLAVIEEYRAKIKIAQAKMEEFELAHEQKEAHRRYIDHLRTQRLTEFMTGFSIISLKLKEMYQMITLGGDAELDLVDSTDPFTEGIAFSVRPPKKSWKQITNLSGGEKTLASLSLVFALHHYRPTPLYFMDEIDAALDFRNVTIIGNYIKRRTRNAQFIIISLRNHMFELADLLVGIYKTSDQSKSVSLDPDEWLVPGQGMLALGDYYDPDGFVNPRAIQSEAHLSNAKKRSRRLSEPIRYKAEEELIKGETVEQQRQRQKQRKRRHGEGDKTKKEESSSSAAADNNGEEEGEYIGALKDASPAVLRDADADVVAEEFPPEVAVAEDVILEDNERQPSEVVVREQKEQTEKEEEKEEQQMRRKKKKRKSVRDREQLNPQEAG